MNILQIGPPKCGNFWLYKIIQQLLTATGNNSKSFIEQQPIYSLAREWDLNFPEQCRIDVLEITDLQIIYRISSIFRMPIENLKDYIARTPHVWTHSPVCKKSGDVFNLFDKKVYIIRDPRDRAISAAKYYCSDYMLKYFPQEEKDPKAFLEKNFDNLMHEWVWHVFDHIRLSKVYNIHISWFEGFLLDFQKEFDRLLKYLDLYLDESRKKQIENEVAFSSMKKENPKHLKKGQSGYWMDYLTEEQIEKAEIIAGPLIRFLRYTKEKGQPLTFGREEFPQEMDWLKEEILESQQSLYSLK
jgi:aryl sulfotransferase